MRTGRIAVLVVVLAGCSGGGGAGAGGSGGAGGGALVGATGGGGGGSATVDAALVVRLDAAIRRGLAALESAEQGVTPGKRLDPKVRVRMPLTRDPSAPAPAVSVTYYHELACKHCAALRTLM